MNQIINDSYEDLYNNLTKDADQQQKELTRTILTLWKFDIEWINTAYIFTYTGYRDLNELVRRELSTNHEFKENIDWKCINKKEYENEKFYNIIKEISSGAPISSRGE